MTGPTGERPFDVIDVIEILVHWHAGRSLSEMSQSLSVDRKTIRKYVAPAIPPRALVALAIEPRPRSPVWLRSRDAERGVRAQSYPRIP